MAYQSLYRKYRSRDFSDLVGQHHVTQTLANAIASGRVAHAYLFCGPRGTGKTSTARVLAKALNCVHGPTAKPCDECPHCQAIRQGSAMDVIEIDAASNRNIDDIRQLREQVNYPPVELRYKFYIVDEVHQLTKDSFNAFLKTLEEPPGHVIFVLCTTDPHQLPATILSRCQRFDFHRITLDDIVERMRWIVGQEGWTVEDEGLYLLARAANGGLRDALSLLDQAASYAGTTITAQHVRDILGGIDLDLLLNFSDFILRKDANGLFQLIDRILAEGKDVPQLVAELIQHWRNLLRVTIGGADALVEFTPGQREQMAQQAGISNQQAIMRAITMWCEAENELRWNSQQRILLELYSLRIMTTEPVAAPVAAPVATPPHHPVVPRSVARPAQQPVELRQQPTVTPVHQTPHPEPVQETPVEQVAEEAIEPPTVATEDGELTFSQIEQTWSGFVEWLKRSPQLEKLRNRIVEKCQPRHLRGTTLVLVTNSKFTRSQVYDRPQVKQALEQCLHSFYKVNIIVEVEAAAEETTLPEPPPVQNVAPQPSSVPVEAPLPTSPAQDVIGERMAQVFSDSKEIS
ncbi:MAG TPA: DNA polymerase III subunit gamma/tau [Armatimonadota bacterium]|nr:DNA polymerase III subunit gamma/tau [Armatimonadota bacterium]